MRRKLVKIERNISISIQYARLQEEINSAQLSILDLNDKKGVTSLKKKKIEGLNTHIEKVGVIIREIEANHKPKEYKIILKDQLGDNLSRLSKQKYFEMLKYNFAISTILDSSVVYKYSEKFFEYISDVLFQDKSAIISIQKSIDDIYWHFSKDNTASKAMDVALKNPLKMEKVLQLVSKKYKILPKPILIQSFFYIFNIGTRIIQKKMYVKKMRKLSETEFEYILTTTLLCLQYAKMILPEVENKMYFSFKLQVINAARSTILKEFFEDGYDVKENLVKINSLKIFDNYLIEKMKCYI